MPKKLTTKEFIFKANFVHGNKYDYSKFVYAKSIVLTNIIQHVIKHLVNYTFGNTTGKISLRISILNLKF